jgi:hypothetical protein
MNPRDSTETVSTYLDPFWKLVESHLENEGEIKKRPSLFLILFRRLLVPWLVAGLCYAMSVAAQLAVPTFLQQIILFLQFNSIGIPLDSLIIPNGVGIAFVIFSLQLANSLTGRSYEQISRTITINVRTALIGAIYEKVFTAANNIYHIWYIDSFLK